MCTGFQWWSSLLKATKAGFFYIDYPLLDNLDVAVYSQVGTKPIVSLGGDGQALTIDHCARQALIPLT